MSYIEKNLLKDEVIIAKGKLSNVRWVFAIAFSIIFIWTLFLPIIILLYTYLSGKNTEIAITNKRIIGKKGIFSTNSIELKLDKIESVQTASNFLGYGNIIIKGSGGTSETFVLMADVEEFKRKANEVIHK